MGTKKDQENGAKSKAAKAALKEQYQSQTVQIEDDLRVVRFDEFNWQIQKPKDGTWKPWPFGRDNYYGKLPDALQALPATMLGAKAKGTLADIWRLQRGISATIETAVNRARLLA